MECVNKDIFTIIRAYLNKTYDFEVISSIEDIINLGNKCGLGFYFSVYTKEEQYI